ncbi:MULTISPECIES: hypothetical protein [Methylobacterium]|uniref:hypothetical protein n=1 Tax=Methylobacterium TaxID=407 RepID=UPI00272EE176|nr:hypothetical protein [Methylobacterium sp.]
MFFSRAAIYGWAWPAPLAPSPASKDVACSCRCILLIDMQDAIFLLFNRIDHILYQFIANIFMPAALPVTFVVEWCWVEEGPSWSQVSAACH